MQNQKTFEVTEIELSDLLVLYREKLSKLENDRKVIEDKINLLANKLNSNALPNSNNIILSKVSLPLFSNIEIIKLANGYVKQWPWQKKIIFILKEYGKPMTVKQIGEYVFSELEPELLEMKKKITSTISGQISLMFTKHKTVNRESNERNDFIYSLK